MGRGLWFKPSARRGCYRICHLLAFYAHTARPDSSRCESPDGKWRPALCGSQGRRSSGVGCGGGRLCPCAESRLHHVASAGGAGNARIGSIDTLAQAMPGVVTVTNEAALTNGTDAESDPALRKRFIAYIASLSKATMDAVGYAITSVKPGLSYALVENQTYEGDEQRGYFYVVVDDDTGMPTQTLIATVYTAIEAVRPLAVHFSVFAPVVVKVKVQMKIQRAGADHTATAAQVAAAIKNYINTLGLGATLPYTRLAQIAYDASPAVTNVFAVQLNGATDDLIATPKQTFKAGTIVVT